MRVIVYVEGESDRDAMEALLKPLLEQKREMGISINFRPAFKGDRKKFILLDVPLRAANTILNDPHSIVAAMPDLYPKNKGFEHKTFEELEAGIVKIFNSALQRKHAGDDDRLRERFKVFCFKHELEALILAAEEALRQRLGIDHLEVTWQIPVENQDHDYDHTPKRIVKKLFEKYGQDYEETVDAPLILEKSDYRDIAEKCPQCFKPFVEFLESLQPENRSSQSG